MSRSRFLAGRSRGALAFAISEPDDVAVNEILFRPGRPPSWFGWAGLRSTCAQKL